MNKLERIREMNIMINYYFRWGEGHILEWYQFDDKEKSQIIGRLNSKGIDRTEFFKHLRVVRDDEAKRVV